MDEDHKMLVLVIARVTTSTSVAHKSEKSDARRSEVQQICIYFSLISPLIVNLSSHHFCNYREGA